MSQRIFHEYQIIVGTENVIERIAIRDPVFSTVPTLQFAVVQHFNTVKVKPVHALIDCRGGREGGRKEGEAGGSGADGGINSEVLPVRYHPLRVFATRWISISMKIAHRRYRKPLARVCFPRDFPTKSVLYIYLSLSLFLSLMFLNYRGNKFLIK